MTKVHKKKLIHFIIVPYTLVRDPKSRKKGKRNTIKLHTCTNQILTRLTHPKHIKINKNSKIKYKPLLYPSVLSNQRSKKTMGFQRDVLKIDLILNCSFNFEIFMLSLEKREFDTSMMYEVQNSRKVPEL